MIAEATHPTTSATPAREPFRAVDHALVRVNNVPFRALRAGGGVAEALDRLHGMNAWLRAHRDPLCDRLYRAVSEHLGDPAYRPLLELKRDVHGERMTKIPAERVLPLLPSDELREWYRLRTEATRAVAEIEAGHDARLAAERELAREMLAHPDFLRATLVSSLDLQEAIDGYTGLPVARHGKRQRKSEPALLSYLLRAMTRTSPYSFYTSVGFARLQAGAAPTLPAPLPGERTRLVEPNHVVIRRLVEAALPGARERLAFGVAPDARVAGGAVVYAIFEDDPVKQPRAFRARQLTGRVPATPALVAVLRVLRAAGAAPLATLAAAVAAHLPAVAAAEARAFLDKLAAARLLVPVIPIAENSADITGEAAAFLRGAGEDCAADAIVELGALVAAFPETDPRARRASLCAIRDAGRRLGIPADTPLFYEDTGIPATQTADLADVRRDLAELGDFIELFDTNTVLPALVRDELVARHGHGGRCAYLDFVDATVGIYERWFKISIADQLPEDLAARHPGLAAKFALRREVGRAIAGLWDGGDEVELPRALLRRVRDALPVRDGLASASYGVFVQPELEDGRVARVFVNPIYQGLGTFFSRFLPLVGPDAAEATRRNLREFFPEGHLVAGVRPVAGFNANLHPPVTDHELDLELPGEPPGDIRAADLALAHDVDTDTVVLLHAPTGRRVSVLYHGFLIPALLPSKWSLLQALASGNVYDTSLLAEIRDPRPDRPRVRFGKVVLGRRHWAFRVRDVPRPDPGESDARYFVRLGLWRREQGIPAEVFVAAPAADAPQAAPGEWWSALGWTREKPQYIDLDSALVTRFFARWLERRREGAWMSFTECRPLLPRSYFAGPEGPHATELVLEINRSPAGGGPR